MHLHKYVCATTWISYATFANIFFIICNVAMWLGFYCICICNVDVEITILVLDQIVVFTSSIYFCVYSDKRYHMFMLYFVLWYGMGTWYTTLINVRFKGIYMLIWSNICAVICLGAFWGLFQWICRCSRGCWWRRNIFFTV